jgi:hypothetical protein
MIVMPKGTITVTESRLIHAGSAGGVDLAAEAVEVLFAVFFLVVVFFAAMRLTPQVVTYLHDWMCVRSATDGWGSAIWRSVMAITDPSV